MNVASSPVNFFQDIKIGSNYTQSRRPVKDVFAAMFLPRVMRFHRRLC